MFSIDDKYNYENFNFYKFNLRIIELINRCERFKKLNNIKIVIEDNLFHKKIHEIDLEEALDLKNLYQ